MLCPLRPYTFVYTWVTIWVRLRFESSFTKNTTELRRITDSQIVRNK